MPRGVTPPAPSTSTGSLTFASKTFDGGSSPGLAVGDRARRHHRRGASRIRLSSGRWTRPKDCLSWLRCWLISR